ncbi:hypothetical protein [Mesorhizobium sp.]|uniref:hypothetical protein n=1 Tax=Mesorhizobium sp. TaxID=1871066 RepID=UPI0025BB0D54|nr:hypothetical protein [Mesorhizobium sp.]
MPDMGRMNGNSQKDSALARWFQARAADGRKATRKTMIVALARKLLIAPWRLVTTGEAPQSVSLRAGGTWEEDATKLGIKFADS